MHNISPDLPKQDPQNEEIRRTSVGPIWQEQRVKSWYWVVGFIVAVLLGISFLS